MKHYFAADLGASNGRTILGRFDGDRLTLEEINRFENNFVHVQERCYMPPRTPGRFPASASTRGASISASSTGRGTCWGTRAPTAIRAGRAA